MEPTDTLPLRTCIEGFIREVEIGNDIRNQQEAVIRSTHADNKMLAQIALEYGEHQTSCAYLEEIETGRIIDNEDEICDCGWSETKKMLEDRLKNV